MTITSALTIRQASVKDAEEIVYVIVCSWKESYKEIVAQGYLNEMYLSPERIDSRVKCLQNNIKCICLVAENEGRIVGICDVGIKDTDKREGQIYTLYVLEEYKRKGIGSKLFNKAIKWLNRKKIEHTEIGVFKENTAARKFYESMGCIYSDEIDITIGKRLYKEAVYYKNCLTT